MRLYRASLRTLSSWAIDRQVFNEEALVLQARFRDNMKCSSAKARELIELGNAELFGLTHPVYLSTLYNVYYLYFIHYGLVYKMCLFVFFSSFLGQVHPSLHAWRVPLHAQPPSSFIGLLP